MIVEVNTCGRYGILEHTCLASSLCGNGMFVLGNPFCLRVYQGGTTTFGLLPSIWCMHMSKPMCWAMWSNLGWWS
jgi:hypothetical protein